MYPGWLPLLGGQSVPEGCMCKFRRFSSPKILKSENHFSNDISIGRIRLCRSRLKLLSICILNVEKYR